MTQTMTPSVLRVLAGLVFAVALASCAPSGPTLSVGDDSPPTEGPLDAPMPEPVDPKDLWEYEQFRWVDGVVDGYAMTYTQECGDYLRADEPTMVWVDGTYFGNPIESNVRPNGLATIPELLEVIVARNPGDTLEFIDGDLGQPERIVLDSPEIGRYFCFELLNFAGSTQDGEGRMPVPLIYDAYAPSDASTSFDVSIPACNGDPITVFDESPEAIIVETTAWIPDGDSRDDCEGGVRVNLDAPIGTRDIIDGFTSRRIPLLTDEILEQPTSFDQVPCEDDVPDCRAGFQVGTNLYAVTCIGVANDGVSNVNFATGIIDGGSVDAFQIKSVGVNIMLAVNMTSGDCSDRAIGPIAGVEHGWSVAVRVGNDPDQLSRFLCGLADLSDEQRDEERCDRFD